MRARNCGRGRDAFKLFVFGLVLLLGLFVVFPIQAVEPQGTSCQDQPRPLDACAEAAADSVYRRGNPEEVGGSLPRIVLFAVVETLIVLQGSGEAEQKTLSARTELARTDKQVGSTATGSGSTTLVEKPGISEFLNFAIEHGAIQREVNGNTVTLSGSPYGLIRMMTGEEDTMFAYDKYAFWRRIGFSANFNLQENQTTSRGDIDLKQLGEYSVRIRLYGDRSPRSKKFHDNWDNIMGKAYEEQLKALGGLKETLLGQGDNPFTEYAKDIEDNLMDELQKYLNANQITKIDISSEPRSREGEAAERHITFIKGIILRSVESKIVSRLRERELTLPDFTRNQLKVGWAELGKANAKIQEKRLEMKDFTEVFKKSPLLTLSFTQHRDAMMSDYSELKLLYERRLEPLDFIANAGLSAYNDPNPLMNQSRIRDFHVSLSLEGKGKNFFRRNENDLSKSLYSVSYRYERMKETGLDLSIAQAKIEFPIGPGVSIPFSITYANRTEFLDEKEVRGNFGLIIDTGKLFALTRTLLAQ